MCSQAMEDDKLLHAVLSYHNPNPTNQWELSSAGCLNNSNKIHQHSV